MYRTLFLIFLIFSTFLSAQDFYHNTYQRAQQAFLNKEYLEVIKIVEAIPVNHTYYETGLILKGHALMKIDSLKMAEDIFSLVASQGKHKQAAYNGLGLVLTRKIKDENKIFGFIKNLIVDSDFEKAEKMFLRALDTDPSFADARYNLVNLYIKFGDEAHINSANNLTEQLTGEFPDNALYGILTGRVKLKLQQIATAEAIFKDVLRKYPNHCNAAVWLGLVQREKKNYEKFSLLFSENISCADDEELFLELYKDQADIIPDVQKRLFSAQKLDGKWYFKFWATKDPNPITAVNERFVIHYKRLEVAREVFGIKNSRGYDDRGEIYIKYGEPQNKYTDPVPVGDIKANESWAYKIAGKSYTFDFVSDGSYYSLVDDLSTAINPGAGYSTLNQLINLYEKRSYLNDFYDYIATELRNAPAERASDLRSANNVSSVIMRSNIQKATSLQSLPQSTFNYELPGKDLDFSFSYAYFFRPDEKVELEFYYALPPHENDISQNISIRNPDGQEVASSSGILAQKNTTNSIHQTNVLLNISDLNCYIELESKADNRRRLLNFSLNIEQFRPGDFAMSSLVLASEIARSDNIRQFRKGELKVVPYPYSKLRNGSPIFLYFELYNLNLNENDIGKYTIEFKIFADDSFKDVADLISIINPFSSEKSSQITTSMTKNARFSFVRDYFGIDLSQLLPGDYTLKLKIKDELTGSIATQSKRIKLIP